MRGARRRDRAISARATSKRAFETTSNRFALSVGTQTNQTFSDPLLML
jgi:hypothetical protein